MQFFKAVRRPGERAVAHGCQHLFQLIGGHDLVDPSTQLVAYRSRRAGRGVDAQPGFGLEFRDTGLHHGGQIGKLCIAFGRGDCQRARPGLSQNHGRIARICKGKIQSASHQLRPCLLETLVGNAQGVETRSGLVKLAQHRIERRGGAVGTLVFFGLEKARQLLHACNIDRLVDQQHRGHRRQRGDGRKTLVGIEGQLPEQMGIENKGRRTGGEQQRVAVGLCLGDIFGTDVGERPRFEFNHHRHTRQRPHVLRQLARKHDGPASRWRIREDDADRLAGKVLLRLRGGHACREHRAQRRNEKNFCPAMIVFCHSKFPIQREFPTRG